jgi:DNA helicase-2/ATP-dependent DNA helicase PcrA
MRSTKNASVVEEAIQQNGEKYSNSILSPLNEGQKQAAISTEGYVRVIAGAGSGKTRALAYRFAYLVEGLGIAPNKIMSVTFTNKAAGVMKKRIRALIGDQDTAYINTFHGFCVLVLREDIHKVNYPKSFMIMDEEDQKSLLQEIYRDLNLTVKDFTYKTVLKDIHDRKIGGAYIENITKPDGSDLIQSLNNSGNILEMIFYRYLLLQRKNYALDFDDLIEFVLYVFGINEETLHKWQNRLEYIQVDEFQDVNKRQYLLVSRLSEFHKNLFVVGDPDQTIYTWRGARIEFLLDFHKCFPNVKTILMGTNYRSSPEILSVSNSLIKHNTVRMEKNLLPVKTSGSIKVLHYHAKNVQDEAEWIAKKIKSLNANLSDIAILYRAHYVSRAIEEAFLKHEINYVVHSGVSFYQRQEIKDILSYLRLVVMGDDLSFSRVINVPRRGIGKKRIKLIKDYADEHHVSLYQSLQKNINHHLFRSTGANEFIEIIETVRGICLAPTSQENDVKILDMIDMILKNTRYEELLMTEGDQERLDNIAELKDSILNYEKLAGEKVEVQDYLSKVALFTTSDKDAEALDKIKLMTIHASKGLEFPYVFVCGLNEGIFPSSRTKDREALEEERRLAYVAFTRAENILCLTDAEGFRHDGGVRHPSRFIFNIEANLLEREGCLDKDLESEARQYILLNERVLSVDQKVSYAVGDRVEHPVFGSGSIISMEEGSQDFVIKFDNHLTNRNIKRDFIKLFQ